MHKDVVRRSIRVFPIHSRVARRRIVGRQHGLTLIELMAVLAVALLLVTVGQPGFGAGRDKRHLKGVLEIVQQDLRLARAESIKRNRKIYVAFQGDGAEWCYGLNEGATCDCATPNSCQIDGVERVRRAAELGQGTVALLATTFSKSDTRFDPVHGTADAGSVKLRSAQGVDARVIVSPMGRVRACSPDKANSYGLVTNDCPK